MCTHLHKIMAHTHKTPTRACMHTPAFQPCAILISLIRFSWNFMPSAHQNSHSCARALSLLFSLLLPITFPLSLSLFLSLPVCVSLSLSLSLSLPLSLLFSLSLFPSCSLSISLSLYLSLFLSQSLSYFISLSLSLSRFTGHTARIQLEEKLLRGNPRRVLVLFQQVNFSKGRCIIVLQSVVQCAQSEVFCSMLQWFERFSCGLNRQNFSKGVCRVYESTP